MKTHNKQVGKIGEDFAYEFLLKKGFTILERNWGNKWGEIDIIAKDGDILVFIEVKTKIGINFGTPEEMVNPRKLIQIQKIASSYLHTANSPLRIDVVAVILSPDKTLKTLNHYQAVY